MDKKEPNLTGEQLKEYTREYSRMLMYYSDNHYPKTSVAVRISDKLKKELQKLARKKNTMVGRLIRIAIIDYLDRNKKHG